MAPIFTIEPKPYQQQNEQKQVDDNDKTNNTDQKGDALPTKNSDGATVIGGITGFAIGGPIAGIAAAVGANAAASSIESNISNNMDEANKNKQNDNKQETSHPPSGIQGRFLDQIKPDEAKMEDYNEKYDNILQKSIDSVQNGMDYVNDQLKSVTVIMNDSNKTKAQTSSSKEKSLNQHQDTDKSGENPSPNNTIQNLTDSFASGADWVAGKFKPKPTSPQDPKTE